MHKFLVMNNPESQEFGEVTAYLKVSIAITGSDDKQVEITNDPNPDEESFLQPPEIKPQFYQIYVRFFAAQKIVPLDRGIMSKPSIDAYVRLDYRTRKLKTKEIT